MSTTLIYAVVMLLVVASYCKLRLTKNSSLHPFDVSATLPVRGILALLIVLYHIGQKYDSSPMQIFLGCSGPVVSTFFFISGYGLMKSYIKKGEQYLDHFLQKRLKKILPLFLILTILFIFFPINATNSYAALTGLLKGDTPLPNSWFIIAIIYFYISFYWACRLSKSSKKLFVNISLFTVLYIALTAAFGFGGWWYTTAPAFALGILIANYERKIDNLILSKHYIYIYIYIYVYRRYRFAK